MNRSLINTASILVASDNKSDASVVQKLLSADYPNTRTTVGLDQASNDFNQHQPDVLVLVFKELEKSERYCLGLYRQSFAIQLHPHRTIVLCNKDEVRHAYNLCREGIFDDYILFWPMTVDSFRLSMSVYLALRAQANLSSEMPTAADFAVQVRRLATLEKMLTDQLAQGNNRIDAFDRAVSDATNQSSSSLENFSQRLMQGTYDDIVKVKSSDKLQLELEQLKRDAFETPYHTLAQSTDPLKQWTNEFYQANNTHLKSLRELNALANSIQPSLLVVDDDEFQHKIISSILKEENYNLIFAANGYEVFNIIRNGRPDLILLDVMLPDMSGVDIVKQIKTSSRLAEIPILMITGASKKNVILESHKAGAADIIVKPFVRDIFLDKVRSLLDNP
ncbi:Response regulator receiver domain-containing protein [Nitrosomonas marina]|uniref:Response regulator receiver domain-containing protein n=1 Tax=Nitrosomonas marina TaxID=917 RepID=A0A1I0G736_9PROT|nr:response regulator [Nitrosomonas marina]SET65871.1 Response regulator receiver domain-containing protein [Nitrosomonas marina]